MAVGLAVVASLVAWRANRAIWRSMGRTGKVCALLKVGGFALLALCLLQPQWVSERARKGENVVVLTADNGKGLEIGARGEAMKTRLEAPGGWQEELGETFDVERMVFDERVRSVEAFGDLRFDGQSSDLVAGLAAVERRFRSRPVAAVLA